MKKNSLIALVAVAAAGLTANLKADELFNWTFTTTAGVVDGSGTLTVDTSGPIMVDGYTGYAVTSFYGTYGTQTITGLSPTGTDYADNLLASLTGTSEQLDHDGITFSFGPANTLENLWVPDTDNPEYVGGYGNGSDSETVGPAGIRNNGTFVATPAPVPEPGTLALLGTAGISLLFAGFRRK